MTRAFVKTNIQAVMETSSLVMFKVTGNVTRVMFTSTNPNMTIAFISKLQNQKGRYGILHRNL